MKYVTGDITDTDLNIIMHGCNCQGGFGSGVAGAIAKKFPIVKEVYQKYTSEADKDYLLGDYCHYYNPIDDKIFINLYTQFYYGYDFKRYADRNAVFTSIVQAIMGLDLYMDYTGDIAIPKIGCGLGGLDWKKEVEPTLRKIEYMFEQTTGYQAIEFHVYEIDGDFS